MKFLRVAHVCMYVEYHMRRSGALCFWKYQIFDNHVYFM